MPLAREAEAMEGPTDEPFDPCDPRLVDRAVEPGRGVAPASDDDAVGGPGHRFDHRVGIDAVESLRLYVTKVL